jgi:hypothetical protein
MRNQNDQDDDHDYSPNELARLSSGHNDKYREIVQSNLQPGDSIEKWQQRNMEWAKECLRQQRKK